MIPTWVWRVGSRRLGAPSATLQVWLSTNGPPKDWLRLSGGQAERQSHALSFVLRTPSRERNFRKRASVQCGSVHGESFRQQSKWFCRGAVKNGSQVVSSARTPSATTALPFENGISIGKVDGAISRYLLNAPLCPS